VWVISDDVYEQITYDGPVPHLLTVAPQLRSQLVVVSGVSKAYAMTGWRVGWLVGPADVVKAATNLQSHATSNVANVSQVAALEAVRGDLSAVARMREAFDRRRQTMVRLLNDIPGVTCPEPHGAFYCYPSVKGVLGKQLRGRTPSTSAELAELVLDEVGVAVVPGEAFGTPGYFRLSYALGDEDLEKGVARMGALLAEAR
jgi:aspartate/methionine/tyrosine aminotransferase